MLRAESSDGLDPLLEIVARDERVPLDFRPVVVDRAHGVAQQRGDFRRVVDAQPDQREDAQFGRQQFALFRFDARLPVQQGVEILDERGVELQERRVEVVVKLFQFAAVAVGRGVLLPQFVDAAVTQQAAYVAAQNAQYEAALTEIEAALEVTS